MQKISVPEALQILRNSVSNLETEKVSLDSALGRVLKEPLLADQDYPPFDRVMMDGIAVKFSDEVSSWKITGTQFAGDSQQSVGSENDCIKVMTGSPLPSGTDTVIPKEDLNPSPDGFQLLDSAEVELKQFVHPRASDAKTGSAIFEKNRPIDAKLAAACASVGANQLTVTRFPKIAFIATGKELVKSNEAPADAQIRSSNDQAIEGILHSLHLNLDQNLSVGDDADKFTEIIERMIETHDLIITSGGVSMGDADFVPDRAKKVGFETLFHGVKQKPGGPLFASKHTNGTILIGLPGNPMSCLVCGRIYVKTAIECLLDSETEKWMKLPFDNESSRSISLKHKAHFIPVKLTEHSTLLPISINTSGDWISVLRSDGLALVGAGCEISDSNFPFFPW